MRIRTDSDDAYSEDVPERVAAFYDWNETKAVGSVCEDISHLVAAARQILERDVLTTSSTKRSPRRC